MKFLHTSDWHVGKTLKGRSRLDDQRAVLAEIVSLATQHEVDAVLIAGDLYDSAAPSADSQQLVVRTLLALRGTGAEVIAIAGNHDHPRAFDAYRPLMAAAGITMLGSFLPPDRGGVARFTARSTGEQVNIALLPFLSQRYAVRAADLITATPAENSASYDQLVRDVLSALTEGFEPDAVNIVMSHLTVIGGAMGGGERSAQSIFEYSVSTAAFPADAHYIALGHLHRRQTLAAPSPVVYCGAPLAVDFGEEDNSPVVCLVEARPATPARVIDLPITAGRRLRTVRGTVAEILAQRDDLGENYLRVYVRESARAGLREEITDVLPNALEVRIDEAFVPQRSGPQGPSRLSRTPSELFAEFCEAEQVADARVQTLFDRIHDELTMAGPEN